MNKTRKKKLNWNLLPIFFVPMKWRLQVKKEKRKRIGND